MVSSQLQDAKNNTKSPSRVPHVINQFWEGAFRDFWGIAFVIFARVARVLYSVQ